MVENFEYIYYVETTLQITLWSEENIGLMRHIIYLAHDHATMTVEHKGSLINKNILLNEANELLELIRNLKPSLGYSLVKKKYWMIIESPCLKLEYRWNDVYDSETSRCNGLKTAIHKLADI